jgi:hypothetical protein
METFDGWVLLKERKNGLKERNVSFASHGDKET